MVPKIYGDLSALSPIRTGLFESVQILGGGGMFSTSPRKI